MRWFSAFTWLLVFGAGMVAAITGAQGLGYVDPLWGSFAKGAACMVVFTAPILARGLTTLKPPRNGTN